MIFQLKYKPEAIERIIDEAERCGDDLGIEIPELEPHLEFYYNAFLALSSCRQIGFSEGPIPVTSVLEYSRHYELNDDMETSLLYFISELDIAYLNFKAEKSKSKLKHGKPK